MKWLLAQRTTKSVAYKEAQLQLGRRSCMPAETNVQDTKTAIIGGRLVVSEQCHPYSLQAYNMEYIVFQGETKFQFQFHLISPSL